MPHLASALTQLSEWFAKHQRALPWREDPSPYKVWISEIMLQQTQVQTVIPYFERFIDRYPDIQTLASDTEEGVLSYWAGLGYYARARNLHRTAQIIQRRGDFPANRKEMLQLPGIGPYTAGAILSIAFNLPEPILDANVERVLSRLRRVGIGNITHLKKKIWRLSNTLIHFCFVQNHNPAIINQALMEIGALVCSPRKPDCENCPLSLTCRAFQTGTTEQFPPSRPKKEWQQVWENVFCIINSNNQVLLCRYNSGKWRSGLWDFPYNNPLHLPEALQNLGSVNTKHVVTHHKIDRTTHIFKTDIPHVHIGYNADPKDMCWISLNELTSRSLKENKKEKPIAAGSALVKTARKIKSFLENQEK